MSLSDQDDDSAAMAAAMGFSSFGASNPAKKKRKFNPATDAFVEGQALNALDRGGKKGKGSGGNTVALGKVRSFGSRTETETETETRLNESEIDLDDDGGEGGVGDEAYRAESGEVNVESATYEAQDEDGDDGPNYVDSSRPPPAAIASQSQPQTEEDKEVQARIDAILASAPPPGAEEIIPGRQNPEAQGQHPQSLPQRPPPPSAAGPGYMDTAFMQGRFHPVAPDSGRRGGDSISVTSSRGRGGGGRERNERWYEGYYDPSFNENPWEQLEKEKGLQPVGSWLERGHWSSERRKVESG